MVKLNQEEKEMNDIEAEAVRISNWLNKFESVNDKSELFIEFLLSNLNLTWYEVRGILGEVKDNLRDIFIKEESE